MRRAVPMLLVLAAGCGGAATTPSTEPPATGAKASEVRTESAGSRTVVHVGERSFTLAGPFRHARLGPGFPQDGRSRDGRVVILESETNAASLTAGTFAIVDATAATDPKVVTLDGDFDYDAVSASGSFLYVVHHFHADDRERYQVRAYDIALGTLTDRVVVDKSGTTEDAMTGVPVARVTDPSGPWVYTLYRSAKHPFVHALDSENGFSVCIDIPKGVPVTDGWLLAYDDTARELTASAPSGTPSITIDGSDFTASVGSLAAPTG